MSSSLPTAALFPASRGHPAQPRQSDFRGRESSMRFPRVRGPEFPEKSSTLSQYWRYRHPLAPGAWPESSEWGGDRPGRRMASPWRSSSAPGPSPMKHQSSVWISFSEHDVAPGLVKRTSVAVPKLPLGHDSEEKCDPVLPACTGAAPLKCKIHLVFQVTPGLLPSSLGIRSQS